MYCKCVFPSLVLKDKVEEARLPEAWGSGSPNDETQVHKKQHTYSYKTHETRCFLPCYNKENLPAYHFLSACSRFENLKLDSVYGCDALCSSQLSMMLSSSALIAQNILGFIDQQGRNVLLSSHKPPPLNPPSHIKLFHSTMMNCIFFIPHSSRLSSSALFRHSLIFLSRPERVVPRYKVAHSA